MTKARHSLKDVARRADVSVATVSRYLNGTLDLPEGTRGRVDKAVTDLDYHPNPHARRLSLGRSDSIALVLPDIANPFFSRLAAAIEFSAEAMGKMVSLHATMNRGDRERAAIDLASRNMVDGLVFVTNHTPTQDVIERVNRFARAVIVDEEVRGADVPRLLCDNRRGGVIAGQHLWRMGHRNVAYIGGRSDLGSTAARLDGLREGMKGIEPKCIYADAYAKASGRDLALKFLSERMGETALFAGSDELCIGILEVFRDKGVRVPQDVSIISFDDVRSLHLFAPAITAITQPVDQLGHRAIELLLSDGWNEPGFLQKTERLPVHLTERESVSDIGQ
ncbi:transcriptional regulator, LacI family [Jannaschia faecimaris]|uniref:Transcriptional regulator, LacI family n=1 Tax=Jannaschia faecimaris TaxID=1244108 RepID=A0A1H3U3R2_9RHOB|nr:LacI family DNA-binding transcriptional regulator [Jannaschia faecimaris]SDZ57090.1 transcriptional regulator, LacI family [Jannaschia faecimaris]